MSATATTPSNFPSHMTLYGIETQMLELLAYREEIASDPDLAPAERDESLRAIEAQLADYVKAEVRKVDGVAAMLREFEKRAETLKAEAARILDRARTWTRRHDTLEELAAGVLALLPEGKQKLEGKLSTLALRKCPASVAIPQPDLLPAAYQRVKVTLTLDLWQRLQLGLLRTSEPVLVELMGCTVSEPEPIKAAIAEELKAKRGVPGARLVEDKKFLKVD